VISYSVEQRVRELGIRATLGASRFALMGLVLREGAAVAIVGALLGFVVALIGGYVTSHLVIAIPRPDLATVLVVPVILAVVVLIACFVPARRAARVDPLEVLRMG
jgi:putative ABC transport system permease protein